MTKHLNVHLLEHALDEGVTESEGGGGEAVYDGGVYLHQHTYIQFADCKEDLNPYYGRRGEPYIFCPIVRI